jgi:hypothetical protein
VDEAREAADASFGAIIHYLESYGMANPDNENYVGLVFSLNDLIGGYRRLIAQRQAIMAAHREKEALAGSSSSSSAIG